MRMFDKITTGNQESNINNTSVDLKEVLVSTHKGTVGKLFGAIKKHDHNHKTEFNPDKIPPAWCLAEDHLLSRRPGEEIEHDASSSVNICNCCGYQVDRAILPINCDVYKLSFLGCGYPLLMQFQKMCVGILIMIFLCSGMYNVISNVKGTDCLQDSKVPKDDEYECVYNWLTRLSVANKRSDKNLIFTQQTCNFVAILFFIIFLQFWRWQQRKIASDADISDICAADFTILVKNVPIEKDVDYDDELKVFFENQIIDGHKPVVKKITLAYNLSRQNTLYAEKQKLIASKQKAMLASQKNNTEPDLKEIDGKINEKEEGLEKLESEYASGVSGDFVGWAFVSFNEELTKELFLKKYQLKWKTRMMIYMKLVPQSLISGLRYKNSLLYLESATEPSDIYWENLHFSTKEKLNRRTKALLLELFLLSSCAASIYGLNYLQKSEQKELKNSESDTKIQIISILISILIAVINYMLAYLVRELADYQKFSTRTAYFIVVARQLALAQFANTGFLTFLLAVGFTKNYIGRNGLIESQFYVFIINSLMPPVLKIINIPYWVNILKRKRERSRGELSVFTQEQAQKLFENPPFDIAVCYAEIIKNMSFTLFYAPAIPIGLLWTILWFFLNYWATKVTILRYCSVKYCVGEELSLDMTELLDLTCLLFGVSCFCFDFIIFEQFSLASLLALVFATINLILPMDTINKFLFPPKSEEVLKTNYDEAERKFDTDYDRENPATSERAVELYTKRKEKWEKS